MYSSLVVQLYVISLCWRYQRLRHFSVNFCGMFNFCGCVYVLGYSVVLPAFIGKESRVSLPVPLWLPWEPGITFLALDQDRWHSTRTVGTRPGPLALDQDRWHSTRAVGTWPGLLALDQDRWHSTSTICNHQDHWHLTRTIGIYPGPLASTRTIDTWPGPLASTRTISTWPGPLPLDQDH